MKIEEFQYTKLLNWQDALETTSLSQVSQSVTSMGI